MKAASLVREIEKLGGTVQMQEYVRPNLTRRYEVVGELNGYDVHMHGEESGYYAVRPVSKRGYFDPSADYNSGDYEPFRLRSA